MRRCAAMPFPYNPFCENGVQESPQTFLNPEIRNNDSACVNPQCLLLLR